MTKATSDYISDRSIFNTLILNRQAGFVAGNVFWVVKL